MLGYFPAPYADEVLYSVIARYAFHTGLNGNQKAVIRGVFSSSTAVAVPDLPSHLNALVENLELVWPTNSNELIGSYTLAPLYLPFISPQQANKVIQSMCSNLGGSIHTRSGIVASTTKQSEFFRYCPACMQEQLEEFGEQYWRRLHQLPGIDFCLRHRCFLENASIRFHSNQKHLFVPAACVEMKQRCRRYSASDAEAKLHKKYAELLDAQHLKGIDANRWTMFYHNTAKELGLIRTSRVLHQEVHQLLKETWTGTIYQSHFQQLTESHWLKNLFRKHRKSFHPLKHLLVHTALLPDVSVKQVLKQVEKLPDRLPELDATRAIKSVSRSEVSRYRNLWRDLINRFHNAGVKVLRTKECGGATYAWLYRHDREWLIRNNPERQAMKNGYFTTDYQEWDRSNVEYLESHYDLLRSEPNRRRLTRSRLLKVLPRSNSVEKHLHDLPKTLQWLAVYEESVEEFQLLRLKSAYQRLIESNQVVKRWRLLRGANIRSELVTPKIEAEIVQMEARSK